MNFRISLIALSSVTSFISAQERQVLFSNKNQDKVACYRIPSIVTAKNGTLVAVADERHNSCGDLIYNKNINIAMRTSTNKGKSWTGIKTIIDYPDGQSASDPSMVVDKTTGDIFMFYNYMDHSNNGKEFRFHVVKSGDGGNTWGKAQDITDQVVPDGWKKDFKFITSGRAVQTADGWILNTLVKLGEGVYIIGSRDSGKSWFRLPAVATNADETNIVELPDGRWLLNARVRDLGYRKLFYSSDKGASWQEHTETQLPDPTCNASTLVLGKKIIFSNLHSQKSRENLGVNISNDLGKSWRFLKTIEPESAAYSVLTPLSRKKAGILYESDNYKDIVFESFKIPRR